MLDRLNPVILIIVGGVLVVLGAVLPLLMIPEIKVLPSTFPLNFFSYIASFVGLMMGVIGAALYVKSRRSKK